ncbi:diaminopimelate decarboxylase family protein [Micromonosporaceae bacterium Da 78-11]
MTLTDLLPSLRASLRPPLDPTLWPATARWATGGELVVGGVRLTGLARTYGTPVHVLDEADVRARCAEYVAAFGADAVAYSAKAGLNVGTGRWIAEHGIGCYVTSAQQLQTALLAGFPATRILLGGSRRSVADRDAAYACGAAVVVGTLADIEAVARYAPPGQRVHVRVVCSLAGRSKVPYGFRLCSSTALAALKAVLAAPNLQLAGLDCSLGHQLSRFGAFERCLREAMAFCSVIRSRLGVPVLAINLGGGHAVAYRDDDTGFAPAAFATRMRAMTRLAADRYGIAAPRVTVSPGRSIVARADLTLHRVSAMTTNPADGRPQVLLNGGVPDCADDPDCAGRHTAHLIGRVSPAPMSTASLLGGSPEAGVRVTASAQLPTDIAVGDVVAVAGTGAYHHCPNPFVGRPPVLGVGDGLARTLVRRETVEAMLRRAG